MASAASKASGEQLMGYCVKCKTKVPIKDGKEVVLANGRKAIKGVCPNCGTTVFRFISSS